MNETAAPITIALRIPGKWSHSRELVQRLPEGCNMLRVCYDLSGKSRPTEFKTKADTQLFLVTYKREKS